MFQLISQVKPALAAALSVCILCSLNLQQVHAVDSPQGCGFEVARGDSGDHEVSILGNDFPALHGLTKAVAYCNDKQQISAELTQNYRDLQLPALSADPSAFDVVFTGNNAIVPLLNNGLLQPLDELIQKHIPQLSSANRVTFDNRTMAIAFLVNSQHLYVRDDVLNSIDSTIPRTFSEVISVCEQLKKQANTPYPLIAAFKAGWDLGLEFINHYLAEGGRLKDSVNNTAGARALTNLKAMSRCMHPDFLGRGINDIQAEWQAGNAALAFFWGSRARSIMESSDTLPVVKEHTRLVGAPYAETSVPAATLWWVGFAIPKNITQERAEAGFIAMLKGLMSEYLLANYNDETVWLREDYQASPHAIGVQQVLADKAPAYPSNATIGLLHQAAGQEVAAFLQGRRSAVETLEAIDASVTAKAEEMGLSAD